MLRSLKKAAQSLERNMEVAFSTSPASHANFVNTTLTINGHRLRLGPVFAEGGFSFIHTATSLSNPSAPPYAVKRLSCPDPDAEAAARREAALLAALPPHPNIVAFHGSQFHNAHIFMLFDLVDGGSLPEVLRRAPNPLHAHTLLSILADAAAALTHLHAQQPPLALRDVKLENILYDRLAGCYKLCDFGSASTRAFRPTSRADILAAEDDVANSCSAMYRAPEIADLYRKQFICERVDVWALGCVWHALLFGNLPFDGMSSLQILKGLAAVPDHPRYPHAYIDLLKAMLTINPHERIDSFTVLEHVRTIQGFEMDPELKAIGSELRQIRANDFGRDGASRSTPAKTATELLSLETTPFQAPATSCPTDMGNLSAQSQGSLIDFPLGNAEYTAPLVTATSKQDEGWADFEAAFGAGPPEKATSFLPRGSSSSQSVLKSATANVASKRASTNAAKAADLQLRGVVDTRQARAPPQMSSASTKVASFSETTSQGAFGQEASSSLIDFGELHITRPAQTKEQPKLGNISRTGSARSAPDFSDLIDFGAG